MSLRLRLALAYSFVVALILCVVGAVLYATMHQTLEAEMDRRLQVRADQVQLSVFPYRNQFTTADLTAVNVDLSPLTDLDAPGLFVQILNPAGEVLARSGSLRGVTLPNDMRSFSGALGGERTFGSVTVGDRVVRVLSVPIVTQGNGTLGVLEVGQSREPLRETMAGLQYLLLLLGGFSLGIAGVVGWLVARHGLRPLRAISDQAADIAARRDFGQRLRLGQRQDEVGQLGGTIDQLLSTVDDTLRSHREFIADTSHELRNPLLAIRTNLDLLDRVTNAEDRAECVREARQQVERMSRLVADLLLLARVEAAQVIEWRPVELRALLENIVHEARREAPGRLVLLEANAPVLSLGDEGRLTQVVTNLVHNAIRHTPIGGSITVRLEQRDGEVRITVADTGEGIAPKHLPHIFERFYHVPGARARAEGSTGLGLAIAKHLTEAHGGTIVVESQVGQGTRFTVRLPLGADSPLPHARGRGGSAPLGHDGPPRGLASSPLSRRS